jgi:gamma-glutamylaminecyclotransferase
MMNEMSTVRVFVYGSLRRGQGNHAVIQAGTFVGEARTLPRFTLYNLGPFPALVSDGNTAVVGELYEVDEQTLGRLDRLEGCPRLYQRHAITLEDGTLAHAYVQRLDQVRGRSKIASGNWCAHRKELQCGLG